MENELTPEQAIYILQKHLHTNPDIHQVSLRQAICKAIIALEPQIALEPRVVS